jgi:endonuclease/exonuclease/phosphatase family metal-dependent hydrolase
MKIILTIIFTAFIFLSVSNSQIQHTIMSYNLLNYPGNDSGTRNPYFRTTIANIVPDILVVQEMTSQAGVNGFLNNVLNVVSSGYAAGAFIDGYDTDNAIFYKTSAFTFLTNSPIPTSLRDINEFVLRENLTGDTLRIYSVHLKASEGSDNEQQRLAEVTVLRNITDDLPLNSDFIVVGDFNIYNSNESAYQKLKNQSSPGYFIDIFNMTGSWNNSNYAAYHTQSPRVRAFGGGSNGGMDDRFDLLLMSPSLMNTGGITYVQDTYISYGNDGLHYNDSINAPPNLAVGQIIADALHYSSDHLPILAKFTFEASSIQQVSLKVLIEGLYNGTTMIQDTVTVELRTITSPHTLVDQAKILLNNTGTGSGNFTNTSNGIQYYLVLKHRSGIETWSATGQTFTNGLLTYDFTTGSNKAYGNNLKLVNGKWCLYNGDVNQDGFIDIQDLNLVYTDNIHGKTGYTSTDLNGDLFTESDDLIKVFVNNFLGIVRIKPQ